MSRSVNQAFLIGNVGADPEIRTTTSGTRVASFSVATSRRSRTRDGQQQDRTDWHRIVAWDQLVEVLQRFVRKGDRVYVEGRLEYRSWQDASGRTRYITEINAQELVLLSGTDPRDAPVVRPQRPEPENAPKPWEKDDLPF
jgi:single-strand DNA-binding protein